MQHYWKKLQQFDTKYKTKTKIQQLDRLKLVKSIADTLPDYRHSSNLLRYIKPADRIVAHYFAIIVVSRGQFGMDMIDGNSCKRHEEHADPSTATTYCNMSLIYMTASNIWDQAMQHITAKNNDPRNLIFGLCADSADLHAYGRSAKIKPLLLTNYGMRRRVRCKSKYLWMIGIPPENHKKIDVFLGKQYSHAHYALAVS
jgi:hypothetical protein